jgi:putative intracellular protease/amidase
MINHISTHRTKLNEKGYLVYFRFHQIVQKLYYKSSALTLRKIKIMKIKKIHIALMVVLLLGILLLNAWKPIRNFTHQPKPWTGLSDFKSKVPEYDSTKKTVFIIADYKLTELFDMLAPFFLFNATEKTNVYIVAIDKTPILIKRDLFVIPQLSFNEVDSMQLKADVIVIPALSIRDEHQDTLLISWIKKHFTTNTKMLTICDGASTGAATGLYDGKPITCHASDYAGIKPHFAKPVWVQNVSVTKSGNLFSTAGVSNAVEGSLTVIDELFGHEIMQNVLTSIHYYYPEIKLAHKSTALSGGNIFTLVRKILFRKNKSIGLLLENGINEFEMAGILDTFSRTFPASFKTYVLNNSAIQTKYGLTLVNTADSNTKGLDELHVIMPESYSKEDESYFKNTKIISYDNLQKEYLINVCLKIIEQQYGAKFQKFVRISLDYN